MVESEGVCRYFTNRYNGEDPVTCVNCIYAIPASRRPSRNVTEVLQPLYARVTGVQLGGGDADHGDARALWTPYALGPTRYGASIA